MGCRAADGIEVVAPIILAALAAVLRIRLVDPNRQSSASQGECSSDIFLFHSEFPPTQLQNFLHIQMALAVVAY
jgi:hypothetical protein